MKYAIVEVGNEQYKVSEGQEIEVKKLALKEEASFSIDKVLLLASNDEVKVGQPYLEKMTVKARVLSQFKGEKVRVAIYKAKSRHRRVLGFRPLLTKILIEKIGDSSSRPSPSKAKKEK